jgi:hypothetical protein
LQASLLRKSAQREYDERVMIAIGATRVALPGRISFEAIAHYVYAGATTQDFAAPWPSPGTGFAHITAEQRKLNISPWHLTSNRTGGLSDAWATSLGTHGGRT